MAPSDESLPRAFPDILVKDVLSFVPADHVPGERLFPDAPSLVLAQDPHPVLADAPGGERQELTLALHPVVPPRTLTGSGPFSARRLSVAGEIQALAQHVRLTCLRWISNFIALSQGNVHWRRRRLPVVSHPKDLVGRLDSGNGGLQTPSAAGIEVGISRWRQQTPDRSRIFPCLDEPDAAAPGHKTEDSAR